MKQIAVFSLCSLMLLFGCASGQDRVVQLEQHVMDAESRLSQLESYLKTDQTSSRESEQGLRDNFARMRVELDNMIIDLQKITGRLDQIEFQLKQPSAGQGSPINDTVQSNTDRIARLEKHLNLEQPPGATPTINSGVAPSESPPVQGTPPGQGTPPTGPIPPAADLSEEQLYASARQAFDRNDLEGARQGFEKLIQKFPKAQLAGNSQFWLGEVYFREKWYEKAILEYQKVIENYPKGNKIPSALLKQGLAFLMLEDKANARLIFNELVKKHPKSSEADTARAKLKEL
jgi:tol-pal system protein YbgF